MSWQVSLTKEEQEQIKKMLENHGVSLTRESYDGDEWFNDVYIRISDEDGIKNPPYFQVN